MHKSNIPVLVVEDEVAIRDMIRLAFLDTEFSMMDAENTTRAKKIIEQTTLNAIILDWMLPGQNGIQFIQWLKSTPPYNHIPIIMLSARAEEENRIKGLNTGADDYMIKPFSPGELVARLRALLRRTTTPGETDQLLQYKQLSLNLETKQAYIDADELSLSPNEFKLLVFFMSHADKTFSREQIINHVWGETHYIDERTVDVQIRRLRDKLNPYGYHKIINTVRGFGYQMKT